MGNVARRVKLMNYVGVDVSHRELVINQASGLVRLLNEPVVLKQWACSLGPDTVVGVEATGRYHRPLLEALSETRVITYLLNPMKVARYARAIKPRLKTDPSDAFMVARYVEREYDMLVPFKMPDSDIQKLKDLLSYRETVVEKRVALKQSMSEQTFTLQSQRQLDEAFAATLQEIDATIKKLASTRPLYKRLLTIDGVGPMSASALVWLFESHEFKSSDQAVAFVGLDVSVRQSGLYVGKSKLTKRGPSFIRAFLHCGANSLRKTKELKPLFEHHEAKKLSTTAVNLIVARKIVRIAYALATKPEAHFERKNLLPHLT